MPDLTTVIRRAAGLAMPMAALSLFAGCNATYPADFRQAEMLAARQDKQLLIFYESWMSTECGAMKKLIHAAPVRHRLSDKVVCVLDESYEPNRRYVARYGIDRYPSIVIVRPDGTFHRHVGAMSEAQLIEFLDRATIPGNPIPPASGPDLPDGSPDAGTL